LLGYLLKNNKYLSAGLAR